MARRWEAANWGPPDQWRFVEYDLPTPRTGEVSIRIIAAGMNPADAKRVREPRDELSLPVPIGYEVSGVLSAMGPGTSRIGSGPAALGDEVIAFRVYGGYATEMTVPADTVFAKPSTLSHAAAANLLLAGTTAAEMLAVTRAQAGETVLLHGASGAVGVSALQQAALHGVRVIGTASARNAKVVRSFGGIPVEYGPGLRERVRELARGPVVAAWDAVGTPEAITVSQELVADPDRIVTIVPSEATQAAGVRVILGSYPESAAFRDAARARLTAMAERGELVVPVARTYPLSEAREATRFLAAGHPGGKLALLSASADTSDAC